MLLRAHRSIAKVPTVELPFAFKKTWLPKELEKEKDRGTLSFLI